MQRSLATCVALLAAALLLLPGCGRSDACSVETLDDGSVRISCDDGTEAIIAPPGVGGGSEVPEPCSVEQGQDGAVILTCPGADPVVIPAGPEGPVGETGPPGDPGPGCSVQELDEGGARVVCADGTTFDLPDAPAGEGGCDLVREDGALDLVCNEETFRVAECGNGVIEPGEACDEGSANGQGCTPASGELSCAFCTTECTLQTITFDPVRIEGLVLHANEGTIGAVPGARVRTNHGFENVSDGFGRYAIEVPAGESFTLFVDPVDVGRAAIDASLFRPLFVPLRTAPWQRSFTAPEAGGSPLLRDIRLLSGERQEITTGGLSAGTVASVSLQSRSRGMLSGFFRHFRFYATVKYADLRMADGARFPRGELLGGTFVAYSLLEHEDHPVADNGSFPWSGSMLTALPGDLPLVEGRPVVAAVWIGLDLAGQPLHLAAGAQMEIELVGADLLDEDPEVLRFDPTTGQWVPGGDVELGEAPAGEIAFSLVVDQPGWYALAGSAPAAERCVTGTLTLGGAQVSAGVVGWSNLHASSASSDADGSFCMPVHAEEGAFSLLATALPDDWDRHLGVATTSLTGQGSCDEPTTCVDVGTIELVPMGSGCLAVNLSGDLLSRTLPLSVRFGLSAPGDFRRNRFGEPQWLLGHAPLAAARRVCLPAIVRDELEILLSNDLDPWCPAFDSIGWEGPSDEPVVCPEDCADADADASAFFFCGS